MSNKTHFLPEMIFFVKKLRLEDQVSIKHPAAHVAPPGILRLEVVMVFRMAQTGTSVRVYTASHSR